MTVDPEQAPDQAERIVISFKNGKLRERERERARASESERERARERLLYEFSMVLIFYILCNMYRWMHCIKVAPFTPNVFAVLSFIKVLKGKRKLSFRIPYDLEPFYVE